MGSGLALSYFLSQVGKRCLVLTFDISRKGKSGTGHISLGRVSAGQKPTWEGKECVRGTEGFLITAYPTDRVKEGDAIWTK
jgi:hypothetical protein